MNKRNLNFAFLEAPGAESLHGWAVVDSSRLQADYISLYLYTVESREGKQVLSCLLEEHYFIHGGAPKSPSPKYHHLADENLNT